MNLIVTCEHHFDRTPDGRVWTNGTCPYPFWTRYLPVFESVRVVARLREVPALPAAREAADGEGVEFAGVPDYLGPKQYLLKASAVAAATAKALRAGGAVILRAPSLL